MDLPKQIADAYRRIGSHIRETYCETSLFYSQKCGANVHLKLENLQHTGSFKVRGALNKILSLDKESLERGVITASTGNHGAAVAFAASLVGAKAKVFVSTSASMSKTNAIRRLGAAVKEFGEDPIDAENYARAYAAERNSAYVPPYNDIDVVAGQGTVGLELDRQLEQIDAVFVALGGGGLISGVGGYLRSVNPNVEIIGCSPENSKVMIQSLEMGELHGDLPSLPTLSDGTAGGIEDHSITFDLCRKYVDRCVTVSEDEIARSLVEFMDTHHMQIEGAAAVAVAAFEKEAERFRGRNVVLIICGANIGTKTLRRILNSEC
ncbi:MAG: threonine/serine dehydratase [Acidobacteriota bacterium]|nr:threonine/serine dehydratase [Acidobacteriota bacterium]MDH3530400.1 threonine/serine dehydratase [Acidobacteriota bacterium]